MSNTETILMMHMMISGKTSESGAALLILFNLSAASDSINTGYYPNWRLAVEALYCSASPSAPFLGWSFSWGK